MNCQRTGIIVLAGLLLCGCVATQQELQTQRDMMELKRRLDEAERVIKELQDDASGGLRSHVEVLSRNQADLQAGLDGLRVDLQSMQGNAGDQERLAEDIDQELALLRDELSLRISDHDARLTQLEEAGNSAPGSITDEPKPVTSPTTVISTPDPTPAGESAPELYNRALETIRQEKQYPQGRELMQSFLKRYPADALAINASYWIGETFYAEKNYQNAILQFEEIIQKHGDHPKAASATLKQGLAFDAIGDKTNAKLLYQRVIEQFPLSDEASKAKAKLFPEE